MHPGIQYFISDSLSLLDLQQRESVLTWALQSLTLLMNRNSTSASGRSLQMVCFADLDVLRSTSAVKHLHCRRIFWMLRRSLKQNRSAAVPWRQPSRFVTVFPLKSLKSIPPKMTDPRGPGPKTLDLPISQGCEACSLPQVGWKVHPGRRHEWTSTSQVQEIPGWFLVINSELSQDQRTIHWD
jgi:hypothetical protein